MKKFGKILLWLIGSLLSLVLLYLFFAFLLAIIPCNKNYKPKEVGIKIFVISNGVHTFLTFPVKNELYDWTKTVKPKYFQNIDTAELKYISFGWGDEVFYTTTPEWSDLKFATAFKAIFLPTNSAIHTIYLTYEPTIDDKIFEIYLTEKQYSDLVNYVLNSFKYTTNIKLIKIEISGNLYSNENYFKSKGKYTLFFTCNNWTNKGLKKVGVKTGIWTPFEQSVLYWLKKEKSHECTNKNKKKS